MFLLFSFGAFYPGEPREEFLLVGAFTFAVFELFFFLLVIDVAFTTSKFLADSGGF